VKFDDVRKIIINNFKQIQKISLIFKLDLRLTFLILVPRINEEKFRAHIHLNKNTHTLAYYIFI